LTSIVRARRPRSPHSAELLAPGTAETEARVSAEPWCGQRTLIHCHAGASRQGWVMKAAKARQNAVDAIKSVTPLSARRKLVRARLATRELTSSQRTLPDFLILGGQRCGTSSLYKYLGRHPQIAPSLRKEIEYFTIDYPRGESWYRAHFPLEARRTLTAARGRGLKTFEATPDYLFDPRAPQRTAALLPDAKCIVMLRDPVERTYSHYHHNVRLGQEDLTFREAIAAEDDRLAHDIGVLQQTPARQDPADRVLNFRRFSYVSRGEYADQISRWLDHYPRDQFLFLMADDLFSHPQETLHRILEFVDLPLWAPPEFRNYSYASSAASANPAIPDDLRLELHDHFKPYDERLANLLDVSIAWRRDM
jgi:hypothetical protein